MGEPVARSHELSSPERDSVSQARAGSPARLEDLLVAVGHGDRNAYEAVYTAVASPVYGVARRVLRDSAQAEEVAQEVLLAVWQEAARFDPGRGSALTWVVMIAHRRAVDRVRQEQAASNRLRRSAALSAEIPHDSVADTVEIRLQQEAVRRCLSTLSPMQRESLVLAFYDGYSYPEVAAILGLPTGTVKTRIRDGLIRLRDCVGAA